MRTTAAATPLTMPLPRDGPLVCVAADGLLLRTRD
jgi:hypothetical protein